MYRLWVGGDYTLEIGHLFMIVMGSGMVTYGAGIFGGMVSVGIIRVLFGVIFDVVIMIFPTPINTFLRLPKLKEVVDDNFEYEMFVWVYIFAVIASMTYLYSNNLI